jgi:hypothetical protein
MKPSEQWLKPWQTQKYAGNASIGLGLLSAFASFGLFITRRNDGETHYKWLGTDDYMVMSSLMVGGLLLAWCGRSACYAGENNQIHHKYVKGNVEGNVHFKGDELQKSSEQYMQTAYRSLMAATLVFFAMSSYAFLGGFHSTPTPQSHIGPDQNSDMQLSVFCIMYGLTALVSLASAALSGWRLAGLDNRLNPR